MSYTRITFCCKLNICYGLNIIVSNNTDGSLQFPDLHFIFEKTIFRSSHGIIPVGDVALNEFLQNKAAFDKLKVKRPVLAAA